MVQLLLQHLAWLPESDGELDAGHELADGDAIRALSLCPKQIPVPPAELQHLYRVPHYAPGAIGRGFGPLALDMVLRFCYRLDELVRTGKVILYTERGNEHERVNSAMLVGAYLILKRGWQVGEAVRALGSDAHLKFVCSFAPKHQPEPARALRVSNCWEGLALACKKGWLNVQCLRSDEELQVRCDDYRLMADSCDAAWLIPGKILVCADPVTTANDPNPHTYKHVFPQHMCLSHTCSSASTSTPSPESTPDQSEEDDQEEERRISLQPALLMEERLMTPRGKVPPSFVDMLRECGISRVVRTNSMQESGMVEKSYQAKRLLEYGVKHNDIVLLDGASPTRQEVRKMLNCCECLMEDDHYGSGLLVHCKGGFGRSVIMACCLIISSLDVPGAALLGWVRLARPGAINTPRQEKFLLSMQGSRDLGRYVNMEANCGLGPECSVQ